MKDFMKLAGAFLGSAVVVLIFVWMMQGNDFFLYRVFAPKYEQTRREVFEQSKAFNQGMAQEIDAMYLEYQKAPPEHKAALRSVILHRAADYDVERLPPHLRQFINDLRSHKTF